MLRLHSQLFIRTEEKIMGKREWGEKVSEVHDIL